jgi:hypothetical protein
MKDIKLRAIPLAALALAITGCGGAERTGRHPRAPKTLSAGELGKLPHARTAAG